MSYTFFHGFRKLVFLFVMVAILASCVLSVETVISPTQTVVSNAAVSSPAPESTAVFTAPAPEATLASVDSSSASCAGLRSLSGHDLTAITFMNWSGGTVNVYFVDNMGLEQLYFEMQPGQSVRQETYPTHAWCARDKRTNAALLAVVATEAEQVATILRDIQWQETAPIPNASSAPFNSLRGQQLVFHNDRVYMFGGRSEGEDRLTDVFYSAIQPGGTLTGWMETTSLPGKYYDHVTVTAGDYVYLLTGADGSEAVFFAPFNADGSIGAWKETTPLSPSRQTFAAVSDGNFIYATGGNSSGTQNSVRYASVNPDGSLGLWKYAQSLPKPIQEHSMIAYDGYLYVLGGRGADDKWKNTVYFSAIKPDGTLGSWNTTTPLPRGLQGTAAFESDGYVYLLGGDTSYYTRVLESHVLDEWHRIPSLPAARNGLRAGAYNGHAYAIGGSNVAGHQSTVYHAPLESIFDHSDCTSGWTRLSSGSYAKVSEDQPSPNRVRDAPHANAEIIHQIYPGDIVRVLEGPVCSIGLVFWKVENALIPDGVGWTAEGDGKEYFLEPLE